MTKKQANELIEFGKKMHVKVTTEIINGILYVRFQRVHTSDFVKAAWELQHFQKMNCPEFRQGLYA